METFFLTQQKGLDKIPNLLTVGYSVDDLFFLASGGPNINSYLKMIMRRETKICLAVA